MAFHGLGVTEHTHGSKTIMLIADIAMMTGNIGRRGVGVNPLRGQNNVQGTADMGCQPHQGAGYLQVNDPTVHKMYEQFYGAKMSDQIGLKIPQMYDAALAGKLKALWVMGQDLVQTDPNTEHVKKALNSLEFLVVQEIFMSETAKFANVVLPGASFFEKSGTFTNGERRVQRVNEVIPPLAGTKTDGQIVVDIMNRMGIPQPDYTPDGVLAEIARVVPFFKGAVWEKLGDNGKQWPIQEGCIGTEILHTDTFKRGLGKFPEVVARSRVKGLTAPRGRLARLRLISGLRKQRNFSLPGTGGAAGTRARISSTRCQSTRAARSAIVGRCGT
jgi:formate dehydrogenase major subunit